MIDEIKLQQEAAKAARAQALLKNELLAEAYEKIESELIAAWIACPPRDVDGREAAWRMIHANRKHKDFLHSVMMDGKLAAAELRLLAETSERKKRFGVI